MHVPSKPLREPQSAAANWPILRRFIARERAIGARMARNPWTAAFYEFMRFGMKQAWACLFGGAVVFLLIATAYLYPKSAALSRYDFLFLSMVALQVMLLALRLETLEEAKVILIYHAVGTIMEIFKTSVGSWIYPEASFFRIAGVPLFTGFMYACIGSYLCRAWRLFEFRFTHHPPRWTLIVLSVVIYLNFFAHHYMPDIRIVLFAAAAVLFGRTFVYFKVWRVYRSMPLLLGFALITLFIWLSENIGTFTRTWLYPSQMQGWSLVSYAKMGSWFLLLIISYTLVSLINRPQSMEDSAAARVLRGAGACLMTCSRRTALAVAAVILIGVGLLTRVPLIPWPAEIAKYLGSSIWGAMVLCVIGVGLPRLAVFPLMLLAFVVAATVEASQLWHPAWLDAFRRTTVGVLLLGRYFSFADIAAYAVGIGAAGAATAALVGRSSCGPRIGASTSAQTPQHQREADQPGRRGRVGD